MVKVAKPLEQFCNADHGSWRGPNIGRCENIPSQASIAPILPINYPKTAVSNRRPPKYGHAQVVFRDRKTLRLTLYKCTGVLFGCSWDSVPAGGTGAGSEGICSPEAQPAGGQILGRDLRASQQIVSRLADLGQ